MVSCENSLEGSGELRGPLAVSVGELRVLLAHFT